VHWFFDAFVNGPDLGFNYTQAGQENSFTWANMKRGLEFQFPLIRRLRDQGKVRVETMGESGRWFRSTYRVTPPTSFTVLKDLDKSELKTVWFDSRFYRINLLWENGTLRIRDIHLFNERFASPYETTVLTANECRFFTLPFVDGFLWRKPGGIAGLRLKAIVDGKTVLPEGGDPVIHSSDGVMYIHWPLKTLGGAMDRAMAGAMDMELSESKVTMRLTADRGVRWFLDLNTADSVKLPFRTISPTGIDCLFEGMKYRINVGKGSCSGPENDADLRIRPRDGVIILDLSDRQTEKRP
jgi:hypothetical protein